MIKAEKTQEEIEDDNKREEQHKKWMAQIELDRINAVSLSIKKLRKDAENKANKANKLEKILNKFPDLLIHTNRWKRERYYSKSVNSIVDQYDIGHNCGCCGDSPVEVCPYIKVEGENIYSDPAMFIIGEADPWNGGDKSYDGWKSELRSANIPEKMIEQISIRFVKNEEDIEEYCEEKNEESEILDL